ncbi:hypothetical protein BH18ACT11_BH18ACT11_10120 [soil metagenome]
MNVGAWIMFLIGAIGLWGGLILFIWHYFAAARAEANAGQGSTDEG